MPEVKNCLTCRYEPGWKLESRKKLKPQEGLHDGGYLYSGECQWRRPIPASVILMRKFIFKIGKYLESEWGKHINTCAAWQPKETDNDA